MFILYTSEYIPFGEKICTSKMISVQYFLDEDEDKAKELLEKSKKYWERRNGYIHCTLEHIDDKKLEEEL